MMILVCLVIAAAVGLLAYFIALMLPFLAGFATIVGLIVFLLAFFGQMSNWRSPSV